MVGYKGESNEFDYHITTLATEAPRFQMIKSLGLAHTVRLVNSMTSAFKTLSSLPYVLASNEKNNSHFGELVLTDTDLNVSECTSSNIFWIEDDRLFTPPLETGCVDGIMRKQIKESFHVIEQSVTYPELSNKKVIFSTNVAQLSVYKTIDNHKLSLQHPLIIKIKQLWEL